MSFYTNYRLVEDAEGLTLEIYLDSNSEEFASEFLAGDQEHNYGLDDKIKKLVKEKFSDVKINSVKLLIGTMLVGTLFSLPGAEVFAATTDTTTTTAATTDTTATTAATASTATTAAETTTMAASASVVSLNTTATVTASRLNMRSGPSTDYGVMHVLWQGNSVKIIGESNGWYQIRLSDGRVGWANSNYLSLNNQATSRQEKVNAVIALSKSFLGTPYVFGGDSPSDGGFDCSGFTKYVFGNYGYTLNRLSRDQALNGTSVARANLQPGDLIFYSLEGNGAITHVGINLGNGKMINSPKTGDVVKITDVTTSYWTSRYVTARRIIP